MDAETGQDKAWSWVARRPFTISIVIFLSVWYILEILILHTYGAQTAEAWFYWSKPPVFPPQPKMTEILFAPLSHDLYTQTHITGNLAGLLIVGGYAEPEIGSDQVATLVLGLGYLGIVIANFTAFIHNSWMLAGISGGLLSLTTYTGLHSRNEFQELLRRGAGVREILLEKSARQRFVGGCLFLSIPGILILEPLLVGFNSGHTVGIILGMVFYPLLSS